MIDKLQRIFKPLLMTLAPFIMLGIVIACFIGLFIISWYILIWGLMIGFFLWLIALAKRYLFTQKSPAGKHKGRVIDHDKDQ